MPSLQDVLNTDSDVAARTLLGAFLERDFEKGTAVVRIVETEAYDALDPASHTYKGESLRTAAMFGPAGRLYVYFTYGMHYCCNVVTGDVGHGAGVLIRAVEPVSGLELLQANRPGRKQTDLTNGPAKICQALKLDTTWNSHDLEKSPLRLILNPMLDADKIVQTTRIGISRAADVPWRFYIKNSPYVSRIVTNITNP